MVKVSCDIQEVIAYLIDRMNEGYTKVELIDDDRAAGWFYLDSTIEFVFSERYPKTVGIKAFKEKEK